MTQRYDRAQMLISQGRFDMAEREIRQVLGENPDDGLAHCMLAICAATDESRYEEATREAQLAVIAVKKRLPQMRFKRPYMLRNCRLRQRKLFAGACETQVPRRSFKGAQPCKRRGRVSHFSLEILMNLPVFLSFVRARHQP